MAELTRRKQIGSGPSFIPPEARVALAGAVCLAFLVGGQAAHPNLALAYNCNDGTQQVAHCYGYYDWHGNTNESLTAISVVNLTCGSACSNEHGFVDNEMWLVDSHNEPVAEFWVETGYETWPAGPSSNDHYFCADQRPNGGGYSIHDLGLVPSGDFGYLTGFEIVKVASQTYQIQVESETKTLYGTSTYSVVSPNDIDIGQELAGTGGADAPAALFEYNQ